MAITCKRSARHKPAVRFRNAIRSSFRQLQQGLPNHDRLVRDLASGSIDQGHVLASSGVKQLLQPRNLFRFVEPGAVALAELRPAFGLVAKPFDQPGIGGEILGPFVELE